MSQGKWNWVRPWPRNRLGFALPIFFLFAPAGKLIAGPPAEAKKIQAMAPQIVVDPRMSGWNERREWHSYYELVKASREWGISAIAIDVWHGIVDSPVLASDPWAYYDLQFQITHDAGQKITAEMSSHRLGVNVADTSFIDISPKLAKEISENGRHPDLAYISETGARNDGLVSVWGLDHAEPILKEFWRAFRDRYSSKADWFQDIIIGAGSAGELRFPAYDDHDRREGHTAEANWPGRGLMQIGSPLAQRSLREALKKKYGKIEALNEAWERVGGQIYRCWDEITVLTHKSEVDAFLRSHGQYTQMGQDIFTWYHNSLLEAGYKLLKWAIEVFHEDGSAFSRTPLAIKLPGVHWGFDHRFAQLASGLISTEGASTDTAADPMMRKPAAWAEASGNGYSGFFDKIFDRLRREYPESVLFPIFTCGEMGDCEHHCIHGSEAEGRACRCRLSGLKAKSAAGSLVRGFVHLSQKHGFPVSVENALSSGLYDTDSLRRLEQTVRNPTVEGVTLLRVEDVARSPEAQAMAKRLADLHLTNVEAATNCSELIADQALTESH